MLNQLIVAPLRDMKSSYDSAFLGSTVLVAYQVVKVSKDTMKWDLQFVKYVSDSSSLGFKDFEAPRYVTGISIPNAALLIIDALLTKLVGYTTNNIPNQIGCDYDSLKSDIGDTRPHRTTDLDGNIFDDVFQMHVSVKKIFSTTSFRRMLHRGRKGLFLTVTGYDFVGENVYRELMMKTQSVLATPSMGNQWSQQRSAPLLFNSLPNWPTLKEPSRPHEYYDNVQRQNSFIYPNAGSNNSQFYDPMSNVAATTPMNAGYQLPREDEQPWLSLMRWETVCD
jgi:hypothetical protein